MTPEAAPPAPRRSARSPRQTAGLVEFDVDHPIAAGERGPGRPGVAGSRRRTAEAAVAISAQRFVGPGRKRLLDHGDAEIGQRRPSPAQDLRASTPSLASTMSRASGAARRHRVDPVDDRRRRPSLILRAAGARAARPRRPSPPAQRDRCVSAVMHRPRRRERRANCQARPPVSRPPRSTSAQSSALRAAPARQPPAQASRSSPAATAGARASGRRPRRRRLAIAGVGDAFAAAVRAVRLDGRHDHPASIWCRGRW